MIHIWAFLAVIVTLWVLSPTADAKAVFTTFSDGGGWGIAGGSTMIGISAAVLTFFGGDAPVHMSEELKDASSTVPRAMIWTTVINGLMGVSLSWKSPRCHYLLCRSEVDVQFCH